MKFVITNEGKISHEFSIGDENEQKAHREMMRTMPSMVHEDGNTVTIKPGEIKELTWKFKGDSDVFLPAIFLGILKRECLERLHYSSSN